VSGLTTSAGGLRKATGSGNWDAGAVSTRAIDSGYVEFTASGTNTYRMGGLGHGDMNAAYTDIDFAIYSLAHGEVQASWRRTARGVVGHYVPGDRLRVALESGVVKYYQNGSLVYTSGVPPTLPLRVDSSLYSPGATILGPILVGDPVGDTLESPWFSPDGGTYNAAQTVSMGGPVGSTIRFTVDGSDPTATSNLYSSPIAVDVSLTLKARAFREGYTS